jgi:hypothetical protein
MISWPASVPGLGLHLLHHPVGNPGGRQSGRWCPWRLGRHRSGRYALRCRRWSNRGHMNNTTSSMLDNHRFRLATITARSCRPDPAAPRWLPHQSRSLPFWRSSIAGVGSDRPDRAGRPRHTGRIGSTGDYREGVRSQTLAGEDAGLAVVTRLTRQAARIQSANPATGLPFAAASSASASSGAKSIVAPHPHPESKQRRWLALRCS